jgi:CRISPR-associated protein Cas1
LDEVSGVIKGMMILLNCIEKVVSTEQLMGYEGASAKLYFESLSAFVGPEFSFKGRRKMPPKDPFNSALSFGYTLLLYEMFTAISCRGMSPYAGFLHSDRQNHPALASDLMEEWRPIIVDSLVLHLFSSSAFKPEDFKKAESNEGVLFEKDALKRFINEFERRLRTETGYLPHISARMSFRRAIQCQTSALAKAFEQNDPTLYVPIKIR